MAPFRGKLACQRCSIRLQASFPRRLSGSNRGRPACWRMPASGVAPFACKQASHEGFVAQTVGDQLAGECRSPVLLHSLASKLPTVPSWHTPWETSLLANAGLRRCSIRLQASFPRRLSGRIGARCHIIHYLGDGRRRWRRGVVQVFVHDGGGRITGITRRVRGRDTDFRAIRQRRIRRHRPVAIGICFNGVVRGAIPVDIHINGTARFGGTSKDRSVSGFHRRRIMLRSRRGKLAGKRITNGPGAFAAKAASHSNGLRSRCGRFHGALQAH